jgi:hypothetical protein
MDLANVLAELREELADLDAAIASLEQLPHARPRRDDADSMQAEAATSLPAPAEVNGRNRGFA